MAFSSDFACNWVDVKVQLARRNCANGPLGTKAVQHEPKNERNLRSNQTASTWQVIRP